jgi:hypothetical protein
MILQNDKGEELRLKKQIYFDSATRSKRRGDTQ